MKKDYKCEHYDHYEYLSTVLLIIKGKRGTCIFIITNIMHEEQTLKIVHINITQMNKIIKIKTIFLSQSIKQPINFVNKLIST